MIDSAQLRAELAYCVPLGIPHSLFLGRPNPAPGQPTWTDDDRAKALAWQADRADHCSGCGQRQSDWRDEKGKELVDPPFELVETLCPACAVLEERQAEDQESKKRPRPGLKLAFRRVAEPDAED